MNNKILVTYGSKYGATKEIALKIGEALKKEGFQAEVVPAGSVHEVDEYKAIVCGSAIYVGNWHKNAIHFLKSNAEVLSHRPVWIFSSGPTGEGDPVELVQGVRYPSSLKPIIEHIKPRDVVVFHGHINIEKINRIEKWAVKSVVKKPFGDFRDWDSIVSWARRIAVALNGAKSSQVRIDHV